MSRPGERMKRRECNILVVGEYLACVAVVLVHLEYRGHRNSHFAQVVDGVLYIEGTDYERLYAFRDFPVGVFRCKVATFVHKLQLEAAMFRCRAEYTAQLACPRDYRLIEGDKYLNWLFCLLHAG